MKTDNEIKELLKKYYDAETTPIEEEYLKEYFAEVTQSSPEKDLFRYYYSIKRNQELGDDFDEKVIQKLTGMDADNQIKNNKLNVFEFIGKYKFYISGAAAVVLIGVSIYLFTNFKQTGGIVITNKNYKQNRELAMKETRKAFTIISDNISKAEFQMNKLDYINKTNEITKKYVNINF